jgi:PAS domain S-box-containing protein/putative nucleotidyltransferase with HDIG domain
MKKKPTFESAAAELHRNPRPHLRLALIVAAYLCVFILLDFITRQFEVLPGVVTWYPPAGLTYALLLVFGAGFAPAVTIALFISSIFIYRMPQPPYLLFLWALIISSIYGLTAAFLRKRIRFDWQMRKLRDVTWFVFTTVLVSALLAVLSVSSSALTSAMPRSEVFGAIFHWWIGETVGVLSVTPFLLIFVMPSLKRFAEGQPVRLNARRSFPRPTLSAIGQASSIVLILYWVFGTPVLDEFHPLFLIALPLIWIAMTRGFKGVSAAILAMNSGVVLALWLFRFNIARLGELELLMIVTCIVGLLMGAVVSERKQAEQTLRESEEHVRLITDNMQDLVVRTDLQGLILYASPSNKTVLGYEPEYLVGKSIYDLMHPEDIERVRELTLAALQTQTPGKQELRYRHADGHFLWLESAGAIIFDKGGSPAGAVFSSREITERRLAEALLLESELKFRTLFDRAIDGILIADMETQRFFIGNSAICQMLGYTQDELSGIGVNDIHPPEHLSYVVEQFNRQARGEIYLAENIPVKRKDGSVFAADINSTPFILSGRTYMMGIFRDITERRRAEEALRESENTLRAWLNAIQESAFLLDLEGIVVAANATVAQRLHRSVEEMVGSCIYDFIPPETLQARRLQITQVVESGQPARFEDKRSGRIIDNLIYPVFDQVGQVKHLAILGNDITERKRTEEELIKSEGKFRAIFDNASTGMFIVDLQAQRFFMCNSTCAKMLGYAKEEFLNLDIADIHPGEDMPFINEQIGKFSQGEEGIRSDINFKRKNGSIFASDLSPALLTITDKEYLLISFIDITERKQREEEIQSRTEELSALYQLSRLLADANDLENVIELVNHHAVESVHTTFACIALLEDGELVPRAVYPVRNMEHDFTIGNRQPITALPVCQRVLDKNEPVILLAGSQEVGRAERLILLLDFAKSVCLVPLWVGDASQGLSQGLGLLILGEARQEKREPFTPEKIRLARSIGDQAAAAIRRLLSREQAGRRLQQLASLSEIDRTIASNFDLHLSLQMILKHVIGQLEVDAADVLVLNDRLQTLEFTAGRGFHSQVVEGTRQRLGEGQAGRALLERQLVQIPDVAASGAVFAHPELLEAEGVAAYFAVPLITKGQVKGVMEICHRTPLEPNKEWLDFLRTLAGQAAIAIDNVQMFENLQRSTDELELAYDATIEGWSHALDLRDKETEGHTLRVTEMTVNLARSLGLGEKELVQIRWGALLHDIGKMGVPDGVLLKPGPLTAEEWVAMKKHPTFAYEMLAPIHYLSLALDIPYCHHEKWDGTGYPRGLKGEQIPLSARIFAVVDVWDALTSDRPYRNAWSKEKATAYIKSGSGTHFDPQVVKAFFLENG